MHKAQNPNLNGWFAFIKVPHL